MTRTRFRILDQNADTGPLPFEEEGDGQPWVIFTQQKPDGPHVYAGWVDAMDQFAALYFAREHYGQDRECLSLWAISRDHLFGSDLTPAPECTERGEENYIIFFQPKAGDWYTTPRSPDHRMVRATSPAAAQRAAREALTEKDSIYGIWVAAEEHIQMTGEQHAIWREVSQDYRLARGYSGPVRTLWEMVRAERDIDEYQKDDLKETF